MDERLRNSNTLPSVDRIAEALWGRRSMAAFRVERRQQDAWASRGEGVYEYFRLVARLPVRLSSLKA